MTVSKPGDVTTGDQRVEGVATARDLAFVRRVLSIFDGFDGPPASSLFWRTDADYAPVTFFAECNDLFSWGCSDLEEITPENVGLLEQAVVDTKKAHTEGWALGATDVFCCRVRGMRPQGACYSEKYFDKGIWPLFDAAGPERKTGFGNPVARQATASGA